jgi:histidinol-phosphate aminotransferase
MRVRDTIRRMKPYSPPLAGRDPRSALLLDFNESVLPPPPEVGQALRRFIAEGRLQVYPDYDGFETRLAAFHGLSAEQVIVTNGSDQGIDIVLRALLDAGDAMVFPEPSFAIYPQVAGTLGARLISPPYREDMSYPAESVQEALAAGARVLVVVNPNNPTGTMIDPADLEAILREHPDLAVIVDEAYAEFTGKSVLGWVSRFENLAVLRTFSKAYALPSLRLGFVAANAGFIRELYKIRGPYDVNMMAVVAAEAQLDHPGHWRAYVREVMDVAKPRVEAFLRERGVRFYPGAANFLLIRPSDCAGAVAFLREHGILVRPQKGLAAGCFRLSIGPLAAMERFMALYGEYLTRGRGTGAGTASARG